MSHGKLRYTSFNYYYYYYKALQNPLRSCILKPRAYNRKFMTTDHQYYWLWLHCFLKWRFREHLVVHVTYQFCHYKTATWDKIVRGYGQMVLLSLFPRLNYTEAGWRNENYLWLFGLFLDSKSSKRLLTLLMRKHCMVHTVLFFFHFEIVHLMDQTSQFSCKASIISMFFGKEMS